MGCRGEILPSPGLKPRPAFSRSGKMFGAMLKFPDICAQQLIYIKLGTDDLQ